MPPALYVLYRRIFSVASLVSFLSPHDHAYGFIRQIPQHAVHAGHGRDDDIHGVNGSYLGEDGGTGLCLYLIPKIPLGNSLGLGFRFVYYISCTINCKFKNMSKIVFYIKAELAIFKVMSICLIPLIFC